MSLAGTSAPEVCPPGPPGPTPPPSPVRPGPENRLLQLRDRIARDTGIACATLIAPFGAWQVVHGQLEMAFTNFVVGLLMAGNTLSLVRRGRPLLPYPLLSAAVATMVLVSVARIGAGPLFWVYPAVICMYLYLPRRTAHLHAFVLGAGAMALGLGVAEVDPGLVLRAGSATAITLVLVNVMLHVIGDLQRALERQASTDPLTGAYNRRHLHEALAHLALGPGGGRGHALLLLDVDHFKSINDRHGHAAGDRVLCGLVALVRERVRASDRVYRIGGEEFVLLLADIAPAAAAELAESLRRRVEQADWLHGERVTVSIGVATGGAGGDGDAWLRAADHAMYEAKRAGRNRVVTEP